METKPRIVDLFSGCGGFGLGAELAGFQSVVSVDLDSDLQSSYSLNFPKARVVNADVKSLDASFWKDAMGRNRLDALIGGPPCQGFSRIGKKAEDDPRNSLIGEFYRHVKMLNPRVFVMENVVGLLDENSRDHLFAALDQVPGHYVLMDPILVNAIDHGAPTKRKRVVVIGYDPTDVSAVKAEEISGISRRRPITVQDAISDLPTPIFDSRDSADYGWAQYPNEVSEVGAYARRMRARHNLLGWDISKHRLKLGEVSGVLETKHSSEVVKRFQATAPGRVEEVSRYPRLSWSGYCPTLRAGTGNERGSYQAMRPIHPSEPRVITVREAARLQGFPDWFMFHPSKWHSFRMIGNSVSPPLSRHILSVLISKMGTGVKA